MKTLDLKCPDFGKYDQIVTEICEGRQYQFSFPNGYDAFVKKICGSYGYGDDLWELYVTKDDRPCEKTYITNGAHGYCSYKEICRFLEKIKNL